MTVRLLLFAQCADIVGSRQLEREIQDGSTLQELMADLVREFPKLGALERSIMLSVNQEYVEREQVLREDDEVALITPVSGG
ncbi:MAG: hypothetical protein CL902_06760 [Dehalococcoidia bacterium]|nr:hypothetical protein [Dehalococcoidia bacterium]